MRLAGAGVQAVRGGVGQPSYDYLCAVLVKRQELKVVHEGYVDVLDLPEQRPPPPTQQWPKRPKILTVTCLSDIL